MRCVPVRMTAVMLVCIMSSLGISQLALASEQEGSPPVEVQDLAQRYHWTYVGVYRNNTNDIMGYEFVADFGGRFMVSVSFLEHLKGRVCDHLEHSTLESAVSSQSFSHPSGSHPSEWAVYTITTAYTIYCLCQDIMDWILSLQIKGGTGIENWPQPVVVADIINGRVYWR